MASISRAADGTRRIQFMGLDGKRKTLRMGTTNKHTVQSVRGHVQRILEARITATALATETAQWLADCGDDLYERLVKTGLVTARVKPADNVTVCVTLDDFLEQYITGRCDIKPRTESNYRQAKRELVNFLKDKPLGEITPGDADEFRLQMLSRLGENTVRRHCGRAKQFFRAAVRKRLIPENPFGDMKGLDVKANPDRFYYVSLADSQKVLDACPDAEWRLLFALSRFGGLRCPSEHLALKWDDIDWERNRMTVRSPKTAHIEGKESRLVPLFPELKRYLDAVWDVAPDGEFVITRYRDSNANLRTQLNRIIRRAGLKPWPKLFQNLRSTRETELAQSHPIHVVCSWIGNSRAVATKHYLQITEADFERAAVQKSDAKSDANETENVTQNPAQPESATNGHDRTSERKPRPAIALCPSLADGGETWHGEGVPPTGIEPVLPD